MVQRYERWDGHGEQAQTWRTKLPEGGCCADSRWIPPGSIPRLRAMGRWIEGRAAQALVVAALVLSSTTSCSSVELASVNLEALHAPDGRHKRTAPLISRFGYMLRQFMPNLGRDGAFKSEDPAAVLDPAGECLGFLVELSSSNSDHPSAQATQIRHFAWLAAADPWSLSRERAVLELGRAAKRLELRTPITPPEVEANEAELSEALAGLIEVLTPIFAGGGKVDATDAEDLQAACDLIASLDVGLQGGRRVLKAMEALLFGARGRWESMLPLRELNVHVQRRMAGMALSLALNDKHPERISSPRVRSAAIFANWQAFGDVFLGDELLFVRTAIERGPPFPHSDLELIRISDMIRSHGLPAHSELEPAARAERRQIDMQVLLILGTDFTLFDDRVRTSAMQALGAVSSAGFQSLREEDWTRWWEGVIALRFGAEQAPILTP